MVKPRGFLFIKSDDGGVSTFYIAGASLIIIAGPVHAAFGDLEK